MPETSWQTIKQLVHERANGCCKYCLTAEINIGQALHVEHIVPGAGDELQNLCLACPNCNLSKAAATTAVDTETKPKSRYFIHASKIGLIILSGTKIFPRFLVALLLAEPLLFA